MNKTKNPPATGNRPPATDNRPPYPSAHGRSIECAEEGHAIWLYEDQRLIAGYQPKGEMPVRVQSALINWLCRAVSDRSLCVYLTASKRLQPLPYRITTEDGRLELAMDETFETAGLTPHRLPGHWTNDHGDLWRQIDDRTASFAATQESIPNYTARLGYPPTEPSPAQTT